jgi:galactokinase
MNAAAIEELFRDHFGTRPKLSIRAPGRVNLLGEHVDYNDGPVLPAAIDRAVYLAATEEPGRTVVLYAVDLGEETCIELDQLESKSCRQGEELPGWALYPAGVARVLQDAGLEVNGVRVAYASDVPIGAGLSSSAAVEVGFAALWQAIGGWQVERLKLAQLCQRAENEYVGVACGLMDQFASACGVEGHALYFDTRSLEWQAAPLPRGTALVIADSGVRRDLTTSAYNERRAACEQAVSMLREYLPNIQALRDVKVTEFAAYSVMLPEVIRRRAEHVVKEIARVESALNALKRDDKQAMGALMYAGHKSLRELYEVSTPELDALVDLSRDLLGCIGARLTGAGFGGCTINLVEAEQAQEFIQDLNAGYLERTGRQAQVYLCRASQGVTVEG